MKSLRLAQVSGRPTRPQLRPSLMKHLNARFIPD